jgi:hypothetical protein
MDLLDSPPVILLPKGIVVNTTEVYAEVASHSVLPTEKIWRYWHGKSASAASTSANPVSFADLAVLFL